MSKQRHQGDDVNPCKDETEELEAVMNFANVSEDPFEPDLNGYLSEDFQDNDHQHNLVKRDYYHPMQATADIQKNKTHSSPFNHVPGIEIPVPIESDFDGTVFPVVRISMALACACPYLPMSLPLTIKENDAIITESIEKGQPVLILAQALDEYTPGKIKGLAKIGVWARIVRVVASQNDNEPTQLLCISGPRIKVKRFIKNKSHVSAIAEKYDWILPSTQKDELRTAAFFHELIDRYDEVHELEQSPTPTANELFGSCDEYQFVSSLLFNLSVNPIAKQDILARKKIKEVIEDILYHLNKLRQLLEIRRDINIKVNQELSDAQRENYIQHQIEQLQKEIGYGSASDIENLRSRASEKIWTSDTQEHFKREIAKLQRLNPSTPDYSIQYSYLDTFLNLPWNKTKDVKIDLDQIEEQLNLDHFGLERVKERILEHMAVTKLRNDNKAPILCLVGPPGVGKTSLGKSIASAMGREYGRVAFGGLHDEAEIRGHRRTYIGAMPGRIVSALLKTEYSNPVIVLDEIDKIGKDYKGDPSTALLEVLDPEQNSKFHDNYLDADYDLSHILFIATANTLETVSGPLRDRMEIISIPGYISAEKIEIAKRHLLPKQLEANGMS
ncbi:MAG: AAA family ATPase, partial [Muribaculaceae bacterium]|nr:AAA family ATPase [Muribaculaceae bacterium]